ncbi:DUF262 domain-containing protein [Micrococcus luteus]|uniref:DUF262 domain-containing protein n=1 Tax=Micrococcus luteus TaxID=1270 RepID=UPI0011803AF5|nr:DUF262 domain-containing protein [Micrococcus luteus]
MSFDGSRLPSDPPLFPRDPQRLGLTTAIYDGMKMKSFDSRVYSVGDYREWSESGQLVLSPRFQRREVWTETARSYLMDTIIRGLPIPKVFIRQIIDPSSGKSVREVVDGQQRLRTILSYVNDGFVIRRGHNREHGGLFFSQLPEDKKLELLGYEISTDLLVNLADSQILDIFSRLNSHAVVLNEQEKINASHFSEFKKLADAMAHEFYEYWIKNRILREPQVMRMADVSLSADLLIAMCDGVQSKKQIRSYYTQFEKDFPYDSDKLAEQFRQTIYMISRIFPDGVQNSEFRRIHIYYSLFTAVFHELYGLRGSDLPRGGLLSANLDQVRSRLDHVDEVFGDPDSPRLTDSDRQFLNDSRRATTDASVRQRRTEYLLNLIQRS